MSDEELAKVIREYVGILAEIACLEAKFARVADTMENVLPSLKLDPLIRPDLPLRDMVDTSIAMMFDMFKEQDRLVSRKDRMARRYGADGPFDTYKVNVRRRP